MAKKSQSNAKSLVIVESPAKAKTINRYLGSDYEVMASMGHVRDLPVSDLGIDLENSFAPAYEVLADKKKLVTKLKKAATGSETVYLATDLDREGEAIAWHLIHALGLDEHRTKRVVFNEITKSAIQAAFDAPHELNMDKVNAQQARRLLDRLVGYQLSPLLQSKLGRGLSAGRVQSVAVRLICDREAEIRAFRPQESWRVSGCFATDAGQTDKLAKAWEKFLSGGKKSETGRTVKERTAWLSKHACLFAELVNVGGKDFSASHVKDARKIVESLGYVVDEIDEQAWEEYAEQGLKKVVLVGRTDLGHVPDFTIKEVKTRRTSTKPNAPFTTASLQQAASSELGFAPSRTMRVAQQLYEGIDLGGSEGRVGLITYMRTDSTQLSADSIAAVRELIGSSFGDQYLPKSPNVFGKAKRAQEAHEAVRPSDASHQPDDIAGHLTSEQQRLYDLIWRRFVSCQMVPAQWDGTTILIAAETPIGEAVFKTTGRRLVFDGFLRVSRKIDSGDVVLPQLDEGSRVGLLRLDPQQLYTAPPPRFSEAALVKKMEAEGIGRPSTYAAIIQTIQDRSYVELIDKRLHPTDRGEMVTAKLVKHFPKIMDVKFTSFMEEELDKIEEASVDWVHVLDEFYGPFRASLDKAQVEMERAQPEPSEYACPECGKPMVYRIGRNGRFLSCSAYPECKTSMNVDKKGKPIATVIADEPCPECGKDMVLRRSKMGPFLGCSGYPECSVTKPCDDEGVPLEKIKAEDIKETCDECSEPMNVKFSRGKSFLGCTAYPKCKATKPMPPGIFVEKPKPKDAGARCDKCGRPIVIRTGRRGPFLSCSGFPRCRNAMPMEKIDELRAKEAAGEIPDAPPPSAAGNGSAKNRKLPLDAKGKVDIAALGPPPPGFAWTRTGRPVVETWPEEDLVCPDCGGALNMRTGRFGPYFGCAKYPRCRFVSNLRGEAKKRAEAEMPSPARPKPIPTNIPCEECGEKMVIRSGRTGPFLGCSKYPKCKCSKPLPEGKTVEALTASGASTS